MWQIIVVLFVIAAVLIYVIRHYVRILRGKAPMCCECSKCCSSVADGCNIERGSQLHETEVSIEERL
ncbi:MAG: hypothetical protein RBS57_12750 [Desulforhabdus sp.]|jgi:hypothetical protein|nr:hypothetical protein [Desulforhabdus sp.]